MTQGKMNLRTSNRTSGLKKTTLNAQALSPL